jgi:hypothetical protein
MAFPLNYLRGREGHPCIVENENRKNEKKGKKGGK